MLGLKVLSMAWDQALKQQIAALEEHVHHLELDSRKRHSSLKGAKNNLLRQASAGYSCSVFSPSLQGLQEIGIYRHLYHSRLILNSLIQDFCYTIVIS